MSADNFIQVRPNGDKWEVWGLCASTGMGHLVATKPTKIEAIEAAQKEEQEEYYEYGISIVDAPTQSDNSKQGEKS